MRTILIGWASQLLVILWVGLLITLAIVAVASIVGIVRYRVHRGHRRRRNLTGVKERRPPRAVG